MMILTPANEKTGVNVKRPLTFNLNLLSHSDPQRSDQATKNNQASHIAFLHFMATPGRLRKSNVIIGKP